MEKYIRAQMDVIEFEAEDVITTSTCVGDNTCYCNGGLYDTIGFGCANEYCTNPE